MPHLGHPPHLPRKEYQGSSLSLRPGIIGAAITNVETPAADSFSTAESRAAGLLVRGSITRVSSWLRLVKLTATRTRFLAANSVENIQVPQHEGILGDEIH